MASHVKLIITAIDFFFLLLSKRLSRKSKSYLLREQQL